MDVNEIIIQLNKEKEILINDIQEKDIRLHEIDVTITNLMNLLQKTEVICPECNGAGQKFSRSCAEDEGEYKTCHKCRGIGKVSVYNKK